MSSCVKGGLPGTRSSKILERADGTRTILPAKCDRIKVVPGDILHFRTWGGGGWGDPRQRDPARVLRDVRDGVVSSAAAESVYGVVLDQNGISVDQAATADLRKL